jgi:hypothetical protein
MGVGRKSFLLVKTVARVCGDVGTLYVLCHHVFHVIGVPAGMPVPDCTQLAFCTAGAACSGSAVQVDHHSDDDYNMFIRRFLDTQEIAAIWPRTVRQLQLTGDHTSDDLRRYVIPEEIPDDQLWLAVYVTDGTRKGLDSCMARLKWGRRGQSFRLRNILPARTRWSLLTGPMMHALGPIIRQS